MVILWERVKWQVVDCDLCARIGYAIPPLQHFNSVVDISLSQMPQPHLPCPRKRCQDNRHFLPSIRHTEVHLGLEFVGADWFGKAEGPRPLTKQEDGDGSAELPNLTCVSQEKYIVAFFTNVSAGNLKENLRVKFNLTK